MNAERSVQKNGWTRGVFCVALALILLCGIAALNGLAAGKAPVETDMVVDTCSTHTAMVTDGNLYIWGSNGQGQFPESDLAYTEKPVQVLSNVKSVSVADNRTMVLLNNGELYIYGYDPITGVGALHEKVDKDVVQIACSETFSLYVTKAGELKGWGRNDVGQLGTGDREDHLRPVSIIESGVAQAQAGSDFAMALKKDGTLWGWGSNTNLQLGSAELKQEAVLDPVQITDEVKEISLGTAFSCVLKTDGTLYSCGLNSIGQLGTASRTMTMPLTKIMTGVDTVSAGDAHVFARKDDGNLYSWGSGMYGQLGTGKETGVLGATVSRLDYAQVVCGGDTTFGVASDGTLWGWGANTNRVLGTSLGDDMSSPAKILNDDLTWAGDEPVETEDPTTPETNPGTTPAGDDQVTVVHVPFVEGRGNNMFSPSSNVTRAEFLKMAVIGLTDFDENKDYGASGFDDVDAEKRWYAPYVAYAKANGLISGDKGSNNFRPNDTITRAEAAKITALAMKLEATATTSSFSDVTGWAVPYVEVLTQKGVLNGYKDGTFAPKGQLTRAEAVKIVAASGIDVDSEEVKAQLETVKNPYTDVNEGWYYGYVMFASGLLDGTKEG